MFKNSHTPKSESDTETDSDQPSDPDRALSDQSNNYKTRHKSLGGKPFKKVTKLKTLDKGAYLGSKTHFDDTLPSLMNLSQGHANLSKIDVNNQHSGHENVIAPLAKIQKEGAYESFTDAHAGNNKDIIHGNILQNKGGINFANLDFIAIKGANILSSLPLPKGRTEFSEFSSNNNNSINVEPKEELIMPQKEEQLKSLSETQPGYNKEGESEGEGDETAGEVSPKGAVQSVGDESNNNPVEGLVQDEFKDVPEKASDEKRLAESILESQADLEPGQRVELEAAEEDIAKEDIAEAEIVQASDIKREAVAKAAEIAKARVIEAPHNIMEVAEAKEQGREELMLFAQDEQQLNNHEEPMSKFFVMPEYTPRQIQLNAGIKQIKTFLNEGEAQLSGKEKNAAMLLGLSGAGKSTLKNMLTGWELKGVIDPENGNMSVHTTGKRYEGGNSSGRASPIGHDVNRSETSTPLKDKVNEVAVLDTPGFNDSKGFEWDIAYESLKEILLKNTANLKFILVVDHYLIAEPIGKGYGDFINVLSQFAKMFTNVDEIKGCVSLVVSKADAGRNSQQYKNIITKILKDNDALNSAAEGSNEEAARKVLEFLRDSVEVFHKPVNEEVIARELTMKNFESLSYYSTEHHLKNLSLPANEGAAAAGAGSSDVFLGNALICNDAIYSRKHKAQAEETLGQYQFLITIMNNIIKGFFDEQLSPPSSQDQASEFKLSPHATLLPESVPNIFSRNYDVFIKNLLPDSYNGIAHPEEDLYLSKERYKEENFLKLRQLQYIKNEILESRGVGSDIQKLEMVLKVLKRLCVDNVFTNESPDEAKEEHNPHDTSHESLLSRQIGGYIHMLKHLVEFEKKFSEKLGAPEQSTSLIAEAVKECNILVNKLYYGAIHELTEEHPQMTYGFYEEAVTWLTKSLNPNKELVKAIVYNKYQMGKIEEATGRNEAALTLYNDILQNHNIPELNSTIIEIHERVGEIHLRDAQVHTESAESFKVQAQARNIPNKGYEEIRRSLEDKSREQFEEAGAGYKAAIKPFIAAGKLLKVEECFTEILRFARILQNDLDKLEIYTMKGHYYASLGFLETARLSYAYAKECTKDIKAKQALQEKIDNTLVSRFSASSEHHSAGMSIPESKDHTHHDSKFDSVEVSGADSVAAAAAFQ